MRSGFDKQLNILNQSIIEMGAMIEHSIALAAKALVGQDVLLAKLVVQMDADINVKEKEIESLCLKLLLQQQPVAKDLRMISTALKMVTDMERIGHQAADMSEITILLAGEEYIKKLEHIPQMAIATIKMVTESIDAYVKKDIQLAEAVIEYDDVVDNLFVTIKDDLFDLIKANVSNAKQALDLLLIAKYFERIGDHAVNIAEWVIFSITGQHINPEI